ncbi:hypothetical protein N4G69_20240 [Streptomyces mirabilis]|uniref:hypothetical protein n=1 Tax=Streptomyces mirabilis TaxID=68239 RepID=UPI0021BF9C69|nr:hypothetical protein [Streptomyces mirabilis]MCT9107936.1 hypothetical protein [Streptomyces mirabilis]
MTNTKAPVQPGVKMTIRVYTVGAGGAVTEDRGTVTSIRHGETQLPEVGGYPPCTCSRCQAGRAVTE